MLIPNENIRELRIDVNPTSIKFKFSRYIGTFYVQTKNLGKVGEKQSIMSLSMYDREISPSWSEFIQILSKPHPWLKF